MPEKSTTRIARALHTNYQAFSAVYGWETQEETRVGFDELPEENRNAILATVDALLSQEFIVSREEELQALGEAEKKLDAQRLVAEANSEAASRLQTITAGLEAEVERLREGDGSTAQTAWERRQADRLKALLDQAETAGAE